MAGLLVSSVERLGPVVNPPFRNEGHFSAAFFHWQTLGGFSVTPEKAHEPPQRLRTNTAGATSTLAAQRQSRHDIQPARGRRSCTSIQHLAGARVQPPVLLEAARDPSRASRGSKRQYQRPSSLSVHLHSSRRARMPDHAVFDVTRCICLSGSHGKCLWWR